MRFEIRKFDVNEPASCLLNDRFRTKHIKDRVPIRPKKGLHIDKRGYTINIVFSGELNHQGLHNFFLRLSQREVFQLARLFKGDRTDGEFLAAIMKEE